MVTAPVMQHWEGRKFCGSEQQMDLSLFSFPCFSGLMEPCPAVQGYMHYQDEAAQMQDGVSVTHVHLVSSQQLSGWHVVL